MDRKFWSGEDFEKALLSSVLPRDSPKEPRTLEEALSCPEAALWRKAMQEELASLRKHETWRLVPPGPHCRPIGCKWVFKIKYNGDGTINKYKARLVAQGFMQRKRFDYNKTFSPVAKMTSIRVILAVAAHAGWTVHQMDVNSAYLNGDIDKDIFMSQPPGFQDKKYPNWVCLLGKGLYGIKQAGRLWYAVIKAFLLEIGFRQSDADPCVFI